VLVGALVHFGKIHDTEVRFRLWFVSLVIAIGVAFSLCLLSMSGAAVPLDAPAVMLSHPRLRICSIACSAAHTFACYLLTVIRLTSRGFGL
jgi:hypothetical protein